MADELKYVIEPWEHQKRALQMSRDRASFAYFMDMGVGKTATAINACRERYKKHQRILRTLVVCPIGVCEGWKKEFKAHASEHVSSKVRVLADKTVERENFMREIKDDRTDGHIVVTNFHSFSNMVKVRAFIKTWEPELVIIDESHKIKNPTAKASQALFEIGDKAPYKFVLSGTPLTNGGLDIFGQYRFLDSGKTFGRRFTQFRSKYYYDANAGMEAAKHFPKWLPYDWTHQEINKLIYKKAIRVMKDSCLDLPPFVRQTVDAPLGEEQEKAYKEMLDYFITYINDEACVAQLALTKALRLQQILSGYAPLDGTDILHKFKKVPRLDVLRDVCAGIPLESKFVIWASFKENYKDIEKVLGKLGIGCEKYVGGMTKARKDRALGAFQNNPQVRAMIAAPGSMGTGVDGVQIANYSVYYNRTYNLEHDLQSNDRIYRGGSEIHKKVTRIDIKTPGTIDEQILLALKNKLTEAEAILQWRKNL